MLNVLEHRSRDQHRSQIFLCRMKGVCRVGLLVQASLERYDPGQHDRFTRLVAKVRFLSSDTTKPFQMIACIIKASNATSQSIELHHFLPLHTLLLGIYARLFAILSNIAMWLQLDMLDILIERSARRDQRKWRCGQGPENEVKVIVDMNTAVMEIAATGIELGTKVERPAATGLTVSAVSPSENIDSAVEICEISAVFQDKPSTGKTTTGFDVRQRPASSASNDFVRPTKRKKKNAMDDIFNF